MAANFFNATDRAALLKRVEALAPNDQPRWGKMTVAQMVCHLRDQLDIALGERPAERQGFFLMRTRLGRWLALYALPWRKGKEQAPREMNADWEGSEPEEFEADKRALLRALYRFAETREQQLAPHPFFGSMTKAEWGRMVWKHIDHHLRQFDI